MAQLFRTLQLISIVGATLLPYRAIAAESAPETQPAAKLPPIINTHEHIQSLAEAPKLVAAMDRVGIAKTVLVGSSWFTITLKQSAGFTRYDQNNEELLQIVQKYPGRFEAWPTINPLDTDALEKLRSLVSRGATGLKLYLGHGLIKSKSPEYQFERLYFHRDPSKASAPQYFFHVMALDDPRMLPIYAYCQQNFLPVCLHINPGPTAPGFAEEFIAVLDQFPDLKLIAPHFILSSERDSRLREFLDTYPNLYSDISFGHDTFLREGLLRFSRRPETYRELFRRYSDRFMFGTDTVVTEAAFKDADWLVSRYQTYVDLLTKETFQTPLFPGRKLNGLALPPDIIKRVFSENYQAFLDKYPRGTKITREIDWSRMGVKKIGRAPGQVFPPRTR